MTAPTLDTLYDVTLAEDAAEKSVPLTGIADGDGGIQPLRVTALSGNTSLIAAPFIDYTSPNSTGTLRFTPATNKSGLTTITVTVEDGGADGDLSTATDNEKFTRSFNVTVTPVNDAPTLAVISDLFISEDASQQTVALSGISAGGGESQPLRVRSSSSNTGLIPNPTVTYTSPGSTGSIRFTPQPDQYGSATLTVTVEDAGLDGNFNTAGDNLSFSRSFVVHIAAVNDAPLMDAIANVTVNEDASEQSVNLTGISAEPSETQSMRITAASSNPGLIPNPSITYTSPNATGTLTFTPVADLSGSAIITVTLEDGGLDDNFSTTADNLSVTRTFTITVVPVNDAPTLDPVSDLALTEDDLEQAVNLTGISDGGGESQSLKVTATSSNTGLIPNPSVTYTSPDSTGSIRFIPVPDKNGSAVITLLVEDAGLDGDLSTTADNGTFSRTFTVTVSSVNDTPTLNTLADLTIDEDAATQTVDLSGITAGGEESQPLRVTAVSSNTGLIPNPSVTYSTPDSTGTIRFTPVADQSGVVTIHVSVEDGGLDGDLATTSDNLTFMRSFVVTVTAVNDGPTLNTPASVVVSRNASEQNVNLTGILAGGGESQPLRVTASSSNSSVIPDPSITYSSPDSTGSLRFTPAPATSGSVTITVTVEDGGLDEDLSTSSDNAVATHTFTISVNDPPTLDSMTDVAILEDAAEQTVTLTGISAGDGETQTIRISASSSNASLIPVPGVTYTSPDSTGSLTFKPAADQSGSAVITVTAEDAGIDGDFSTAGDNNSIIRTFTVTVASVNDTPTLDSISNLTINEDAPEKTVALGGISAGGGESQTLRITASSSNTTLIADPSVTYSSPDASGSIRFTPAADLSGVTTITVTVEDAGLDNDFSTTADNLTFSQTFSVTVDAVNDAPTVDAIADVTINEDSAEQTVTLSGITAGGGESQPLRVTSASSDTSLIPNPTVTYTSADTSGDIRFTSVADQSGSATITVTVEDGGLDGDLNTTADNAVRTISFRVTVNPVNDTPTLNAISDVSLDEDAGEQTISLVDIAAGGGESQPLRITASSSNTALIPNPSVSYASPAASGSLKFTPAPDQFGISTITVTVEDGGLDGDLGTSSDNLTFSRYFTVTIAAVNDKPTVDTPADITVDEDSPEQTVELTGITAGGGESQPLKVTVSSSNTGLIPQPIVIYTTPNSFGSLQFTPVAELSGSSTITLTIEDGGLDENLSTTGDNQTITKSFVVVINAVNDAPTLDSLYDLSVTEDSVEQGTDLFGITAGSDEVQALLVTAVSSNPEIVPNPTSVYTSPDSTGIIKFTPAADRHGVVTITVTVEDAGLDGDLSTSADNGRVSQSFTLTVTPVNDAPALNSLSSLTIDEDAAEQTVQLTGIFAGPFESQPLRVTASSSNTELIPTPSVTYTSDDTTGTLRFTPISDLSGSSTITVVVEDGGLDGNLSTAADNLTFSRTFVVTVNAVNDLPTLDALYDLTLDEDASEQTVSLAGITAGGGESQPLNITASSSNPALIPTPVVIYSSANTTGSITFTPLANQSGSAVITVVVEDGGLDGDVTTTGDNATFTRTFTVTVNPVNDTPTLDSLSDMTMDEDAATQTVSLSGISAGGSESQPLRITASSSNLGLIPSPTVDYTSANTTGSINFTPGSDLSGTAVITVVLEDGGLDGNLSTTADNLSITRTFTVTVNAVNDAPTLEALYDLTLDEDASEQTIDLAGISAGGGESQPLNVTVSSSNTGLIPIPGVIYTPSNATGSIKFTPVADLSGSAIITVVVEDGGLDGDLSTAADNLTVSQSFTVTVNPVNDNPTLDAIYDLTIDEDAAEQTVELTGIAAGPYESQPLRVTATSSNTGLFLNPTVVYTSDDTVGSIKFTPIANQSGSSIITVVVEDGGLDGILSTADDNLTVTRTFSVTVNPVNDVPTLDAVNDLTIDEDATEQTIDLSGITAGGGESQPLNVTVSSSNTALIPTPGVIYTSANATGSITFTPVADLSGSAIITVVVEDGGLDGDLSTAADNLTVSRSFTVTVNPVNDAPTLDALSDQTIDEDAAEQTVDLSGITAGGGESQPLNVTVSSSNTALIPTPGVIYTSADAIGSIKFTPVADQSGLAVITVVVEDGGLDGDLSTAGDNLTVSRSFTVIVNPVNDVPTLDDVNDLTIDEDAAEQTVNLTGIAAGGGESQPLNVTVSSSNTALIPTPGVIYTSANATGSITFTPVADQNGSAIITVVVEDGGLDGDLSTAGDNLTVSRSFTVIVNPVNDVPTLDAVNDLTIDEDAAEQTVNLTGIAAGGGESQPLNVTVSSSNTGLIPIPDVIYTSANATGSIKFTPVADLNGSAIITVVVEDGGLDGDLSTAADNLTVSRSFTVTVNPVNDVPTLDAVNDLTIDEDAAEQTVSLTGIAAGGGESQPLNVAVSSSNPGLIPTPGVIYTSANATGSIKFTPVADQSGLAVITVVVEDGGLDGDLSTTGDNLTVSRSFTVTVNPVNDVPTLDAVNDLTIDEDATEQTVDLSGITAGGGESQPLNVTVSSSNTALIPTPGVIYTSANATGSITFTPVADLSGSAVITVVVEDGGLDGDLSTTEDNLTVTQTFTVTVNPVNDAPTLDALSDQTIDEDAAEQTVDLSGITAGGGESQPLNVTVSSSNTALIPTPGVIYTSANAIGSIKFTPVADLSGSAIITVVLEDGGLDGDLSTAADNLPVSRSFTITVNPINDVPTLDAVNDLTIDEDAAEQTVNLTGIAAGGGESQPLNVTVSSNNTGLIPTPGVIYTSANATGSITFTPVADQSGSAVITVVVEDGGLDGDLSTSGDNLTVSRSFTVTVNPVNDVPTLDAVNDLTIDEDAAEQTVNLTGIAAGGGEAQPLKVTVSSSNTGLIPTPGVIYTSANATGSIKFTPVADLSGSAVITVVVEDGGLDGDLSTAGDNLTVSRSFTVTVNPVNDVPTLDTVNDLTIDEDAAEQTVSLTGIAAGGGEAQPLRVTASSSNAGLIPTPSVIYLSADATGSIKFTPVADQSGWTVITVVVEDGGLDGDLGTAGDNLTVSRSFTVTVNPVNDVPTLDTISNLTINEDAAEQTVNLTGIAAGGGEAQPLKVIVSSSNTGLIPAPGVIYTSASATGSITFTPVADLSGSAVITVVVEDGGLDGDLSTAGDNLTVSRSFTVTVNPVNDAPTLDSISDRTINEDAAEQTVNLTGIAAGGGESQPLRVTVSSSNTGLIPTPAVIYSSANATGSIKFTPVADLSGSAVITLVVEDGGLDGDLSTVGDNLTVSRSFTVTVNPVNDVPTLTSVADLTVNEDAAEQTVNLTGISAGGGESQPLRVTASSSNTTLIATPTVSYTSASATGSVKFTPVANLSGSAVITVVVEDGGLDGDLSTAFDNLTVARTFTVTVNPINDVPTLDTISNITILEDSAEQTISLSGITAGSSETQPLQVTVSSSNTAVIPQPSVSYLSPGATGALKFTPVLLKTGSSVITVTVEDGGLDGNLATTADNLQVTRSFTVTVQPIRPVIQSPLTSTDSQTPLIQWTAVPGATSYRIYISNVSTGINPLLQGTSTTTQYQVPVNLGVGRMDVWVRAVKSDGTLLPWSAPNRFTVTTRVVIAPVPARQTAPRPTFTWAAIPGATKYDVWIDNRSIGQSQYIRTTTTSPSWTPTVDLPMSRYQIWVRALAADNTPGTWSPTVDFYIATAPTAVTPTTATFNRRQTFEWTPVAGATSYGFQLRNLVTGATSNVTGLSSTSFTPSSNLPDGTYAWWAIADSIVANFRSDWSARVEIYVGGRPTVVAPVGQASSLTPVIQWQPVIGAVKYDVWVDRTFGSEISYNVFQSFGVTATSWQVPKALVSGAEYRVWIRAISTTGETSVWSKPADFKVAANQTESQLPAGELFASLDLLNLSLDIPQLGITLPAEGGHSEGDRRHVVASRQTSEDAGVGSKSRVVEIPSSTSAMISSAEQVADMAGVDESIQDIVELLLTGDLRTDAVNRLHQGLN